jgi:predicted MFS family arabinose efflux permease
LWYVVFSWVCWNYAIYFFLTWLPTYLVEYRHFPINQMAIYASLPLLAGMIGNTVGGILTDRVVKKTKNLKFARAVVAVPALLAAAGLMLPAAFAGGQYTALVSLVAAQFFLECVQGPQWSLPMDIGGKYAGTVAGLMNGFGNLAGALSPIIFGFLVQRGLWQAPFLMTAILLATGACIWAFLIDPEKSVTGGNAVGTLQSAVAKK